MAIHKAAAVANSTDIVQVHSSQLSENIVYMMGLSFILGCFFTILLLILLDYMRRDAK